MSAHRGATKQGGVAARLMAVALLGGGAGEATAQIPDLRAGGGLRLESYSFRAPDDVDLDRVLLFTVPVSAVAPVTRQVEIGISGAFAHASLRRQDGRDLTLSGLTDMEVRATAALADDRLRLGVVALLPTGQNELSAEEMDVAGVIAADLLPFAISNWGSGGGVGVSVAAATPVGYDMALGLSAGYVVAREFEPVAAESFAYRPGNQLHVRAALDRSFGAAGKGSVQLVYQRFGQDLSGGDNLYQAGNRVQAVASYAFAVGAQGSGIVYGGYLRRQRGRYTDVVQLTPAQDLVYGGAGLRRPFRGVLLQPSLDFRVLGNEDGLEQGYTVSAGTAAELPYGRVQLVPAARLRFGSLTVREGRESGFTGIELGVSVRSRRSVP